MLDRIDEAADFIRSKTDVKPRVGLILGSGLGGVVDIIETSFRCSYSEIPNAPVSAVAGHSGNLIVGRAGGLEVVAMQGRVHYYEGRGMDEIVFLPRVLARLGLEAAIVTNAAGGANPDYQTGDLMLISDHINMLGQNPLRGPNDERLGVRFPDMSEAYSRRMIGVAKKVAADQGLQLREGVYLAVSGPSYETPAEIRAFRTLGADAVGMSTVPEVIALNHMGVEVLGISCVTNMAAGILPQPLTHAEVMETTARVQKEFSGLVIGILAEIARG